MNEQDVRRPTFETKRMTNVFDNELKKIQLYNYCLQWTHA